MFSPKKSAIPISIAKTVLRELYRSVVTKLEFSNTAKLSVFKSFFVPIFTYSHESWVMTERILSQVQATEMGFLRRVNGVTLHDKVRSCEIHEALNADPFLIAQRYLSYNDLATCPKCPRKDWRGKPCRLYPL